MTVTMHLCCPLTVKTPARRKAKLSHLYNVSPVFRHQTTSAHTLCNHRIRTLEQQKAVLHKTPVSMRQVVETSGLPLRIDVKLGNYESEQ